MEQNKINQDIEKLGKEIVDKKLAPEVKNYSERDLISQHISQKLYPSIRQTLSDTLAGKQDKQVVPQTQSSENDKYLPDYLKNSDINIKNQVENLLENTIRNGLSSGIKEARKMPPFILDAYHDALIDKLHEELVKRKMI